MKRIKQFFFSYMGQVIRITNIKRYEIDNQPEKDPLDNTWLILQKHLKKPIDEFIYYFNLKYKNQSIMGLKLRAKSIKALKLDLPIFLLNLNWRPE